MRNPSIDVLVVGSGAGAAGCVPALAASGARILVAECGQETGPEPQGVIARGKRLYQENGAFPKSAEGIAYYRRLGLGGTIDVSCANGVSPPASYLSRHDLDLRTEIDEVVADLGISLVPETHSGPNATLIVDAASRIGHGMSPMPKFIDFSRCNKCALCELRCAAGAVWSAGTTLKQLADVRRIQVMDGVAITQLELEGDVAVAAIGVRGGERIEIRADTFVLTAGALGTPAILQRSGIRAGDKLFLDLYVVVYGQSRRFSEKRDIPMTAVYAEPDDSFVIAPYVDIDLWHAVHAKQLSRWLPRGNLNGLMVKIADDAEGSVASDGTVHKRLTPADGTRFERGVSLATRILVESGADPASVTRTAPRGAHPGGTAAYRTVVDESFRVKGTRNVYVADASLLPQALGKPPIVTIMALARKMAKSLLAAEASRRRAHQEQLT
jgi:choline dehydrogenase-like flavoprotein